jgi:hypothetical protein
MIVDSEGVITQSNAPCITGADFLPIAVRGEELWSSDTGEVNGEQSSLDMLH